MDNNDTTSPTPLSLHNNQCTSAAQEVIPLIAFFPTVQEVEGLSSTQTTHTSKCHHAKDKQWIQTYFQETMDIPYCSQ